MIGKAGVRNDDAPGPYVSSEHAPNSKGRGEGAGRWARCIP